jgi:endonuclease/exonuclease/phosphatase family metal-dependent hydrolase
VRRSWLRTYGNSLVVRGRVLEHQVLDLPRAAEREPRTAIVARVRVRETELSVAVTHLQHWPKRHQHLPHDAPEQLRVLLGALQEMPAPRVLLGDLNLTADVVEPIVRAAGFALAEHGPTFPAQAPRTSLDHIAVDGFVVQRSWVADQAAVSDHRAVVADLGLVPDLDGWASTAPAGPPTGDGAERP